MTRVDWPRVDASVAELFDSAAIDAAVDEGLRLGDLRFRRTLRLLQAVAVAAVVVVSGAALMLQGSVHAESERPPPPPPTHALPVVQSVSPAEGSHEGGLTVAISGRHLGDVDTVRFGTTAVSDLEDVSDDTVVVVTPAHAPGPVSVSVVTGDGRSSAAPGPTFRFLPTPAATGPRLTMLSPDSGPPAGGTEVTVWGSRLDGARAVSFGASSVGSDRFVVSSDTSITLRTPEHDAGPVDVTVTTDAGTSGPLTYTYTGESPPGPTDGIPVVKSVDPASGSVEGGEEVTITGANLADATTVEFGDVEATVISQDEGTITVTTPKHEADEVAVVVTSRAGESVASPSARYTYLPVVVPRPVVTGIEPDIGPTGGGQQVTIRGTGLAGATGVDFGGVVIRDFLADTATAIVVATPAHDAGPVAVTVTTEGGTSQAADYVFADPPTITGLAPLGACPNSAPEVTVSGAGFTGPAVPWVKKVTLGDLTVAFHDVRADQLTFLAPARPPGGPSVSVPVTVTTPAGTSAPIGFIYYDSCVE